MGRCFSVSTLEFYNNDRISVCREPRRGKPSALNGLWRRRGVSGNWCSHRGACPWPGDEAKNGREADWDKSARTLLIGSDANGGAAATMRPQIATFKEQGGKLHKMLKGQGAQLQKISDSMAKDGKKYIDAFIGVTIAFGFLVAALGIVGVWCLSEKKGCHFSSLFLVLAQVLGLLFVVLLIVLVTLQASTSAFLAEVCYQPVPETAMLDVLTQSGRYNVLAPGAFDVPTLKYYMTCDGTNELDAKLGTAAAQIAGLGPELDKADKCDTSGLAGAVPAAAAAMTTVRYTVACPRISNLLLAFTRDAVCTHMVDGLYFLWTAQAAGGVFLVLALVMMRLAQQGFHESAAHEKKEQQKQQQQKGKRPVYKGHSSVVKEHELAGAMSSVVAGGPPRTNVV